MKNFFHLKDDRVSSALTIAFVGLAALHLIAAIALPLAGVDPSPVQDPLEYRLLGLNLLHGNGFSAAATPPYAPQVLRTPGYPLFLAGTYAFDPSGTLAILLQQVLLVVSAWLLVLVVRRLLGSERLAFIAGIALLAEPFLWMLSLQTMSETLFLALTIGASFVVLDAPAGKAGQRGFIAGVLAGIAVLTRPIGILYLPLLAAGMFASSRSVRTLCLFVVAVAITLLPWVVRNDLLVGAPIISSSGAYNIVLGFGSAGALASPDTDRPVLDGKGRTGTEISLFEAPAYAFLKDAKKEALARMSPFGLFEKQLSCAPSVWFDHRYPVVLSMVLRSAPPARLSAFLGIADAVLWTVLLALTGVGLVSIVRKRAWTIGVLAGGIVLGTVFMNICVSYTRMQVAILPFILILAAYGVAYCLSFRKAS